jgi:hypothetical protein
MIHEGQFSSCCQAGHMYQGVGWGGHNTVSGSATVLDGSGRARSPLKKATARL